MQEGRDKAIKKAQKRLAQTFDQTKFAGATMVPLTAKPGGRGGAMQLRPGGEPPKASRDLMLFLLLLFLWL